MRFNHRHPPVPLFSHTLCVTLSLSLGAQLVPHVAHRRPVPPAAYRRKYYSPEALYGDPMLQKKRTAADFGFLVKFFLETGITEDPMAEEESDDVIDRAFGDKAGDWRIKDHVVRRRAG